ncbi:GNAT family N-acetyltransferase [Bosea sp. 2RAB26]|uniref:GNAT family N-acetyltransferase n=1 Tax=Bosea sp. 2RAB26 TaxID=3237476 RepID=UPI003F8E3CD3
MQRSAWGRGCMTEVLSWEVQHALCYPGIFRVEAFCDVENVGSARVMEKVGMIREGLLQRRLLSPNILNEPRDCFVYAKVR